jgi:MSHA biogenesis protein MshJ
VKAVLARYAERINAASLRERAMMFGAAALVLVSVLHALVIEPRLAEQRRLATRQAAQRAETTKLQAELAKLALGQRGDPSIAMRKRIDELRAEINQLNATITDEQRKFTPPEQMRGMLEEVLVQNRKLRLSELKTLPPAPLSDVRAAAGKPAAPGSEKLIYRHGMQLTLSGSYLDIHAYLAALEKLPTQIYWGSMELSVAEYPTVTLKLVVYTVSLDRAWMIV